MKTETKNPGKVLAELVDVCNHVLASMKEQQEALVHLDVERLEAINAQIEQARRQIGILEQERARLFEMVDDHPSEILEAKHRLKEHAEMVQRLADQNMQLIRHSLHIVRETLCLISNNGEQKFLDRTA